MVTYFLDLAVEGQTPQRRLALALRCIVLPMLEAAADAKQQVPLQIPYLAVESLYSSCVLTVAVCC